MHRLLPVIIIILISIKSINAQKQKRVSLIFSGNYIATEGLFNTLEEAMRLGRLDGSSCGNAGEIFCYGGYHPFSDVNRLGYMIMAGYAMSPKSKLWALFGKNNVGTTFGYYDGGDSSWEDAELSVKTTLRTFALLYSILPASFIRLSIGPAFYLAKIELLTSDFLKENDNTSGIGFLTEIGLSVPARTSIFVDASIHYRYALNMKYGPYDAKNSQGEVLTRMPVTKVNFGFLLIQLGLGVRL